MSTVSHRPSRKRRQEQITPGDDRFSSLPSELCHLILARLKLKELIRISSMSTKFKKLRFSLPYLDFTLNADPDPESESDTSESGSESNSESKDDSDPEPEPKPKPELKTYSKSKNDWLGDYESHHPNANDWYRYFTQRNGSPLQRLHLFWYECFPYTHEIPLLNYMIREAARSNVLEELDLELHIRSCYQLPSSVFNCGSLRVLRLFYHAENLCLPVATFNLLQVLTLQNVKINRSYSFSDWLSASCPCLRKLSLHHVTGFQSLEINSLTLEDVSIYACIYLYILSISAARLQTLFVSWRAGTKSSNKTFSVKAPKLQTFKWIGSSLKWSFEGGFKFLQSAIINLCSKDYNLLEPNVKELLHSIGSPEVLELSTSLIALLAKDGIELEELPRHLIINIHFLLETEVNAVISLCKSLTNHQTLTLKSYNDFPGMDIRKVKHLKATPTLLEEYDPDEDEIVEIDFTGGDEKLLDEFLSEISI